MVAKKSRHHGKKTTKRGKVYKLLVRKRTRRHDHKSGTTKRHMLKAGIGKKAGRSKGNAKRKRPTDFRGTVVSNGLYNRIFHLPRYKGEIKEKKRVWDTIHSALPPKYMMPDVEVVRMMESYLHMEAEQP
ncbi:hypothetical protein M5X11_25590 [Paenibacillus alginolyticus]|uniref:hypothetical protein n=1 Tax=Paenibacillus alginolyticus TaxID=59839 RepID=UPI000492DDB8|nr:hypothetical protein [Paenibacillus alginolyticus]MCY9668257.1 hypothetical protein [Paenibacillus alginolyticus]